jgi:hypothetical protein
MTIIDDYNRQLAILARLLENTQQVRYRFNQSRTNYRDQIAQAGQHKFMGDYVTQLEHRFQEFSGFTDKLLEQLARVEIEIAGQNQRINRLKIAAQQNH